MMARERGPMPQVEFEGRIYSLKSRKTEVPDLSAMSIFSALSWLIAHTTPRGYSRPNALAGYGGAIAIAAR
jgi:hypothetical protein